MFPVCAERNVPQALARFDVPPSSRWHALLYALALAAQRFSWQRLHWRWKGFWRSRTNGMSASQVSQIP